ncbi:GNAT family N-acetyltransferase [Haliea sp. E1-2-M8]|uniref:GNAT family N-acetyltransferase n=1 Tax=Haliea sp. E1-2-M8 TaxID=3064706 RepID=UPI00271F4604|nr:GNAT family N-acetyltransferase [Haliea sp. E1-2-M8]MDO8862015.1 GNAT family N-acetyltransferase [Haliea sp. E1-2-M8]
MARKPRKKDQTFIRPAEQADIPVLVGFLVKLALHVDGGEPQILKRREKRRLMEYLATALTDNDKLVVVAEAPDSKLVGMGYIYIWRSQGIWEHAGDLEFKSGIIDNIWVEPEYRKLGIFSAMLRELVAFAESSAAHELILEYSVANKEAEATWSRLGFKTTGVRAAAFTHLVKDRLSQGGDK